MSCCGIVCNFNRCHLSDTLPCCRTQDGALSAGEDIHESHPEIIVPPCINDWIYQRVNKYCGQRGPACGVSAFKSFRNEAEDEERSPAGVEHSQNDENGDVRSPFHFFGLGLKSRVLYLGRVLYDFAENQRVKDAVYQQQDTHLAIGEKAYCRFRHEVEGANRTRGKVVPRNENDLCDYGLNPRHQYPENCPGLPKDPSVL